MCHGLALWLLSGLCCAATASSDSWQVPGAVLKFTIEADPNQPQVPALDLSGRKREDWPSAYYRIDGKTYKNPVAMTCPGKAVYGCKENYRRFVALIGVREDAAESATIVFEVFAGTRKLYTSPALTRYATPVGIDVPIPGRTKEIRLVTSGSSSEGHHWAGWVNAGFLTRERARRVCHVARAGTIRQYELAVFAVERRGSGTRDAGREDRQRLSRLAG
jgi:hypothetical protein